MSSAPLFQRLNAILDADAAARQGLELSTLGEAFLAGGARFIQVRAKQMSSGQLLKIVERLIAIARPLGGRVIVNDRVDVARLAGADGVHLGQDDMPVAVAREMLGPNAIIGHSTHTTEQIEASRLQPLTYMAIGPVFGTRSKDTGYNAVGLELVKEAVRRGRGVPVVAIGGITLETARSVIEAGATSVAVISDLLAGGNPRDRVEAYLRQL